jgi:hypothetical protein
MPDQIADIRPEPFIRIEPEQARMVALALERLADDLRAGYHGDDAPPDLRVGFGHPLDEGDEAGRLAAYMRGWANAWDPDGSR